MPKKLKVVGIGAGNIASHLIPALHNIGCEITQTYSRKITKARLLAGKVGAKAVNALSKIRDDADFYLIMVSDDAIKEVTASLPSLGERQYLAHTSGSTPSTVLENKAALYGSFYALQSFQKNQALDLKETPFLVHGNTNSSLRFFRVLARKLSKNVTECNDADRLKYHMSAVFMNNFSNHLASVTQEILKASNLDPNIILPIAETTFNRILNEDPSVIQTGPARRGDIKTQKKHLKLLKDNPKWKAIYEAISKSITAQYENSK